MQEWDGIHTGTLKVLYHDRISDPLFFKQLMNWVIQSDILEMATTRLFKCHLEEKGNKEEIDIQMFIKYCPQLNTWEAKLHVLQMLPYFVLKPKDWKILEPFIRENLRNENPFVRAWALEGFYLLSQFHPAYLEELEFICEKALDIEKASVKARVRKIVARLR